MAFGRPVLILLVSFFIAYLYNAKSSQSLPNTERVLLLTAHPDDESLFFGPTLLSLAAAGVPVFSLCLSNGNAEGLGDVRTVEYGKSLDLLGISKERRFIVNHPVLQDNIKTPWNPDIVANEVQDFVLENNITKILTFDRQGVSGHPNHISLLEGAKTLIQRLSTKAHRAPTVFALISVQLPTKYIGFFAAALAKFDLYVLDMFSFLDSELLLKLNSIGVPPPEKAQRAVSPLMVYVSGIHEYRTALSAQRMHASQMVWFRWLNVLFSRYMWVNEWYEVVAATPTDN